MVYKLEVKLGRMLTLKPDWRGAIEAHTIHW